MKARRAQERGTVIFVVLMVLTVLSAIGVFASRSAGLNQRTSGYVRQITEANYVADMGITAARYELNTTRALKLPPDDTKPENFCQKIDDAKVGTPCRIFRCREFQAGLVNDGSAAVLFDNGVYDMAGMCGGTASSDTSGTAVPRPEFYVEVTDRVQMGQLAGYPPDSPLAPHQAVITSVASVIPVRPGAASSSEEGAAKSTRVSRAVLKFVAPKQ